MPEQRAELPFQMQFTADEFALVTQGLIPVEMEDKWFIFFEADWLFLHRSWTGYCTYQTRIVQQGPTYVTVETWINQNPQQYKAASADFGYESALLSWLIRALLLGQQVSFPVPSSVPQDAPAGVFQHHIAGSGYPEETVSSEDTKVQP